MAGKEEKPKAADVSPTPSALAAAEVGPLKADASDDEKRAAAEKYAAAKKKARWG